MALFVPLAFFCGIRLEYRFSADTQCSVRHTMFDVHRRIDTRHHLCLLDIQIANFVNFTTQTTHIPVVSIEPTNH